MEELLVILNQVLGAVMTILDLQQTLSGKELAVEAAPYDIEQKVTGIIGRMPDPDLTLTVLLNAINAVRLDTASPHLATTTDILAAVQGVSTDVLAAIGALNIPAPAPSVGDITDGVWGKVDPTSGDIEKKYGEEIFSPWQLSQSYASELMIAVRDATNFLVEFTENPGGMSLDYTQVPAPDWQAIAPRDTRLSWLMREEPNFTWGYASQGDAIVGYTNDPTAVAHRWTLNLSERQFELLRPPAARRTAPVWPGIANVTLGTPVDIDTAFESIEPCDGVLYEITTWPAYENTYDWGLTAQFPRAAYISFTSDNGDQCDVQPLTWPAGVMMVKDMASAVGFLGRARSGVIGSVTPFVINAP
jgi:hypothetical protein